MIRAAPSIPKMPAATTPRAVRRRRFRGGARAAGSRLRGTAPAQVSLSWLPCIVIPGAGACGGAENHLQATLDLPLTGR
jgi:hypothetical protein